MEKQLAQLLNFVAIVESGSITAAADFLGTNKSSVSKKLAGLEEHLNVRLLIRSSKKLHLTDAGRQVYDGCSSLTTITSGVQNTVEKLQEEPSGHIKINITSGLSEYFCNELLMQFQQAYPKIQLTMNVSDSLPDRARSDFDLAIRVMSNQYDDLAARKLAGINSVLCASPSYLAKYGSPRTLSDLANHACLLWESEEQGILSHWTLQSRTDNLRDGVNVSGSFSSNHLPSLRNAALGGSGIGFLPYYLVKQSIQDGSLIGVLTDWHASDTALYGFFAPQRQKPKKLQVLLDFLAQHMQQLNDV